MYQQLEVLERVVTAWPGVTATPHRFGGTEFNLGTVEIGHVHGNGMVDIPFNSKIRNQLVAENKAEPHHLLKETGWITFYVRSAADVDKAIWLFRLNYLFNAGRGQGRALVGGAVDLGAEIAA